jgi:hypothetical protein
MYSTELVIVAVKRALRNRGFKYPKHKSGISKDAVMARRLAYHAFSVLTSSKNSGIATLIGCSPSTALSIGENKHSKEITESFLKQWIDEVISEIKSEQSAQGRATTKA